MCAEVGVPKLIAFLCSCFAHSLFQQPPPPPPKFNWSGFEVNADVSFSDCVVKWNRDWDRMELMILEIMLSLTCNAVNNCSDMCNYKYITVQNGATHIFLAKPQSHKDGIVAALCPVKINCT